MRNQIFAQTIASIITIIIVSAVGWYGVVNTKFAVISEQITNLQKTVDSQAQDVKTQAQTIENANIKSLVTRIEISEKDIEKLQRKIDENCIIGRASANATRGSCL